MPLLARFVEAIEPNPVVRLDVNDGTVWRLQADSRLDPPPPKRARVSTLLADGATYPAGAYEDRVLELRWVLEADTAEDAAEQIQLLGRELDRQAGNILQYQVPGMTHPVFFRTQRLGVNGINMFTDGSQYIVDVAVPAEPFAYGLAEYLRPALNSNTGFESTDSPWTAAGGATLARSSTVAYEGSWSLRITPDGSTANPRAVAESVSATAGNKYIASAWVYAPNGWGAVRVSVDWYDSVPALLSTSNGPQYVASAGEWVYVSAAVTAPSSTATARFKVEMVGTPAISDLLYTDDARFRAAIDILNDPADTTRGMFADFSGIKGDVEAPILLREYGLQWFNGSVMFATRRRGDVAQTPFVLQAEAMTQGVDTATQPNNSTFSGSNNNYSRCTFVTNSGMVTRLSQFYWPTTPSVDARGTYRVFARVKRTSATGTITVRLSAGSDGSTVPVVSTVTTELTTQFRLVDFGLVSIPAGADPVGWGPSGRQLAAMGVAVEFAAQRTSGSSQLDVDYLLFVPADDQLAIIDIGNDSTGDGYAFDGTNDVAYVWDVTNGVEGVSHSRDLVVTGHLPALRPGTTNRLYLVSDPLSQALVTVRPAIDGIYWPRYLSARPASEPS